MAVIDVVRKALNGAGFTLAFVLCGAFLVAVGIIAVVFCFPFVLKEWLDDIIDPKDIL